MTRKNLKKFSIMKWQKWVNSLLIILSHPLVVIAQDVIRVSNIEGFYPISKEIPLAKARINAIDEAKINALKKAGIVENISTFQSLFSSQRNGDFKQLFSSEIQSELKGAVKNFDIIQDTVLYIDQVLSYKIILNAEIIKYKSESDPTFNFKIDGIKSMYVIGENLIFDLISSQDGYLYVFNFEGNDANMLFPNSFEKNNFISKELKYKFPQSKINYELTLNDAQDGINQFLFVFTKTKYPFLTFDQIATRESVLSWLYNIELNQRKINFISLIVRK